MTDEIIAIKRMNGAAHVKLSCGETVKYPSPLLKEKPLRVGRMLDTDEYARYVRERGLPFAIEKAVKLQSMREHTEKEIVASLKRSAYPESVISQVMELLVTSEIVSDERFASAWVRKRARSRGRKNIAMEMKMKGVSENEGEKALMEFSEEEEEEAALRLARKYLKQGKDEQHTIQALMRRGYTFVLAKKAVRQADDTLT